MDIHAWLPYLQWPALAVAVAGAWYVGDLDRKDRHRGFAVLIASNVLWVAWGCADKAWALVTMQAIFFALNTRGFLRSENRDGAR